MNDPISITSHLYGEQELMQGSIHDLGIICDNGYEMVLRN